MQSLCSACLDTTHWLPEETTVHPAPPALLALGWDDVLADALAALPAAGTPARVSRADRGGILTVETADGVLRARVRRRDHGPLQPVVGDWVVLGEDRAEGDPLVDTVLPRRGELVRQSPADRGAAAQVLAANVDVTLVVTGLDNPVNQRRLDRFLTLAWQAGTVPVVVLTKTDRCDDVDAVVAETAAAALGADVIAVSAVTGEGLAQLSAHLLPGRTAVLIGPSGAGKSTLANALAGNARLATGAVRDDGRGRHTTTARELLRLDGGALLIDTPGLRELALWDADEGLAETFADIEELGATCRFGDCSHEHEPGCAVQQALADGTLPAARYESWHKLQRELAHAARKTDWVLRQEQQRRWKQIHKAQRADDRKPR
jgi:ribosome biogenesis GTPase